MVLYDKQLIYTFGTECGGLDIYYIQPHKNTRCHYILHHEKHNISKAKDKYKSWKDIWNCCNNYDCNVNKQKYRKRIKHSLGYNDGNCVCVVVKDVENKMYLVHGVWG